MKPVGNRQMPPLPSNAVEVKAPTEGIEVRAVRVGMYQQQRKVEGDTFLVSKFEQLGSWMKCSDPEMEKKRLAYMAELKEKRRAGASK